MPRNETSLAWPRSAGRAVEGPVGDGPGATSGGNGHRPGGVGQVVVAHDEDRVAPPLGEVEGQGDQLHRLGGVGGGEHEVAVVAVAAARGWPGSSRPGPGPC